MRLVTRRKATRVRRAAGALALALFLSPAPALAEAPDLLGSWHVLIHYRDSSTANPDADRWDDKLWSFKQRGSRLEWTEHPMVIFNDRSGRFGPVAGNPNSRILHAWEPNPAQQQEIEAGLQVNSRGTKTKSLRGSPSRGYKSAGASRAMTATTVGYHESWNISQADSLPVFTREDTMGTGMAIATKSKDGMLAGRTQYSTLEISADGRTLSGTFTRDENREGTFRMVRAGGSRGLESDGRTPNEKVRDRVTDAIRGELTREAIRKRMLKENPEVMAEVIETLGDARLTAIETKYANRIAEGDPSAVVELREQIRVEYTAKLKEDLQKRIAAGDPTVLEELERYDFGLTDEQIDGIERARELLGEERIAALRAEYADRIAAGDPAAEVELADKIRGESVEAFRADLRKRVAAGDPSVIDELEKYGAGPSNENLKQLQKVSETLGAERVAELRAEYADRIAAGDKQAERELKKKIEEEMKAAISADLSRRLNEGDPNAVREMREYQRKQRDRRP